MLRLLILCVVLAVIAMVLLIKLIWMQKAAKEITKEFTDKVKNDTNTLISISSRNKAMCRLADSINSQLRILRNQRHRFLQGDIELKSAITNISHDLRTPLTAICGYLDLLDQAEKNDTVKRYIEVIKNRTVILKQLTEELFRYSIITSPENDASAEPVTINSVLEESIAAYYASLRERDLIPKINISEKKVVRNLNRAALSRVFSNLLNNAIKYSDGDLEIYLTETGKILFINTATGLSEVQIGKLFDRFYTVEAGRKSTGLGLSIAKILVEQMGGTITADYLEHRLSICISFEQKKI